RSLTRPGRRDRASRRARLRGTRLRRTLDAAGHLCAQELFDLGRDLAPFLGARRTLSANVLRGPVVPTLGPTRRPLRRTRRPLRHRGTVRLAVAVQPAAASPVALAVDRGRIAG